MPMRGQKLGNFKSHYQNCCAADCERSYDTRV